MAILITTQQFERLKKTGVTEIVIPDAPARVIDQSANTEINSWQPQACERIADGIDNANKRRSSWRCGHPPVSIIWLDALPPVSPMS